MSNMELRTENNGTVSVIIDFGCNTPCELLIEYPDFGAAAYLSVRQMRELARFLLEQVEGQPDGD